jgi:hypothetical protein
MDAHISGKERRRRIEKLKQSAQRFVADEVLPNLIEAIRQTLGQSEGWQVVLDESDPERQTLLFRYPKTLNYGATFPLQFPVHFGGYIQPQIKLEFGARGEIEPNENKSIRPYVAEIFPQLFTEVAVEVSTLAAERSFWEKVTILHALHHGSRQRDRTSRHYYDTYMMAERGVADIAIANADLLEQVVRNKSLLFSDSRASYDTAHFGSLRLLPGEELLTSLSNDYQAMSEMFMGEIPAFEEVISKLRKLESRINQQK